MRPIPILIAAAFSVTHADAAVMGEATVTYTTGNGAQTVSTDTTLPAVAEIDASAEIPVFGLNGGTASQNAQGLSAARAGAQFLSVVTGVSPVPRNSIRAETIFTETITNTTGRDQTYTFDILLKDMRMRLADGAGVNSGPNPFDDPTSEAVAASLFYEVTVNGSVIYAFDAEFYGNGSVQTLDQTGGTDGVTPTGTVVSSVRENVSTFGGEVLFDPFVARLVAGTFGDGEQITLVATMAAEVGGIGFESGAFASIGDPNNLTGNGVGPLTAAGATPVIPLPAGVWLLLGGLGALRLAAWRPAA